MITPDEMLEMERAAFDDMMRDYNAAIAAGVPSFLLRKPEPPQLRLPKTLHSIKTPFATRKWKR